MVCHSCSKTFPQADLVCFLSLDPESVNQLSQLLLRNGTSRLFWEPTSTRRHFHKHHNILRTFTFLDVSWSKCRLRAIEKQLETSVSVRPAISQPFRLPTYISASSDRQSIRRPRKEAPTFDPLCGTLPLPAYLRFGTPVIFPVCAQVDSCSV